MSASISRIEHLLMQEACRELVLKAAALADAGDADGLAELFLEDGLLCRPNAQPLQGREAIRASYARRSADRITRHLVSNMRVEVETAAQARVHSYVLLWAGSESDAPGPHGRLSIPPRVVGEFDDRLTLTPQGWRIARRDARFVLHAP